MEYEDVAVAVAVRRDEAEEWSGWNVCCFVRGSGATKDKGRVLEYVGNHIAARSRAFAWAKFFGVEPNVTEVDAFIARHNASMERA